MKSRSGLRKLLSSKIWNCCKNISSDMWNSALTQLQFKKIERSRRSTCTTSARHIAQMTIRMTRVTPRKIEMLKKITIEKHWTEPNPRSENDENHWKINENTRMKISRQPWEVTILKDHRCHVVISVHKSTERRKPPISVHEHVVSVHCIFQSPL